MPYDLLAAPERQRKVARFLMIVDKKTWTTVFKRDRGMCRYCGIDLLASFSAFSSATVDHVLSRSRGGTNDTTNLVLACPGCNSMLSRAGDLHTFRDRKAFLDQQHAKAMTWYEELRAKLRP